MSWWDEWCICNWDLYIPFIFEKVMYYSSQIEAAFTKYDISGDDMLNYKEFCDMIHNREEDK